MIVHTERIIEEVENELMGELRRIMELQSPPTVKGESYEDSIKEFFEKYLGSIYDFHTRISIIDFLGFCFEEFKPIENEFDIVATYKTAVPRIILEHKKQKYIPYDSVAFIIQVKQDLDKGKLKSDLEKLKKIRSLPLYPDRIPASVIYPNSLFVGGPSVPPLNILFYLRRSISDEAIESLLKEFKDCWDFLVIVEDRKLLVNYRIIEILSKLVKENLQILRSRFENPERLEEKLKERIEGLLKKGDKDRLLDTLSMWEETINKKLEEAMEKSLTLLEEEHPLITLMCLIPIIAPYPIVCNSTAFFLVNIFPQSLTSLLGPEFAEILLERILKRE